MNLQSTVVLDQAQFPELVHEKIHPRACCPDHFRQVSWLIGGGIRLRFALIAMGAIDRSARARRFSLELKSRSTKSVSTRTFAQKHLSYEKIGKRLLAGEDPHHFLVVNSTHDAGFDRARSRDAHALTRQASLTKKMDPLTGLANYRHLVDILDTEIRRSRRTRREFALLLLDLDGLKQINDHYGHVTGSQALCRLADILSMGCRGLDTAARFGGDEFALVLPETGAESANLEAHRIREKVANDGGQPSLSVSVGVALYPVDGDQLDILLGVADAALYAMKKRVHSAAARP